MLVKDGIIVVDGMKGDEGVFFQRKGRWGEVRGGSVGDCFPPSPWNCRGQTLRSRMVEVRGGNPGGKKEGKGETVLGGTDRPPKPKNWTSPPGVEKGGGGPVP